MTSIQSSSHRALSAADTVAASTADVLLLIGRILLGWIFVRSGWGKIFDIPAYAATFPARGLPPFLAYIAVPAEFFGGIALILGPCDTICRDSDDCVYAGRDFQHSPVLGIRRCSRPAGSGLKFL